MRSLLSNGDAPTLCRLNGVPVKVPHASWALLALVWGALAWLAGKRRPQRSWPARLLAGSLALPVALLCEVGHVWGHTVSARVAGTPMNTIVFAVDMPRTLYADTAVPPRTHRTRALGGVVFNALALLGGLLCRRATPPSSFARELADLFCAGNGWLIAASLTPLPFVDGGSILKWTLVEQGRTEAEAAAIVRGSCAVIGVGLAAAGTITLARGQRLPGVALIGGGVIGLAAARDLLR